MYIKRILWIIAILGLLGMGAFAYFVHEMLMVPNTNFNQAHAEVFIPTKTNKADFIEIMKPLVKDVSTLSKVADQKQYSNNIKPGRYRLEKDMTNLEIINVLRSQNLPVSVKFNNQERIENLAGHIAKQIEADSVALVEAMLNPKFLEGNGFDESNALAMYIPNTYEFYWNTSAEQFRDRMLREYNAFWTDKRKEAAEAIGLTQTEVISLAAIVQKETVKIDERPRVAGVYLNRIAKGMLLQADPTVIYAVKHSEQDFNQQIKRVLFKHLEVDSPYNTYMYPGVPGGVIAMPDISAIDAVLYPENHDYYYFVADVENFGYHKFSKNLSQHNIYRAAYIRWVSQQNRS